METYMFERKMDNCKPCGGAIPLCIIDEFSLPEKIVDRKVQTLPTVFLFRCCPLLFDVHARHYDVVA